MMLTMTRIRVTLLCWLAATPSWAQPPAPAPAPPHKARAAKPAAAPHASGLEMVQWFSLTPQGTGLIRSPGKDGSIDMAARDDETYITVLAKKKVVDLHADREHDFSAPSWSDIAVPRDLPVGPPGSCSSGAYRTIGGQPATGNDLMGGLGGGRC
jgi:hypothetical protein